MSPPGPAPGEVEVLVSVAGSHRGAVGEVAARLSGTGMTVLAVHESIGVVSGMCAPARLAALRAVDGVAAVEEGREVRLPPPGSDVQ